MFLRASVQRRKDGTKLTHFQIAESVWNREKQRSDTRIIFNCGRADDAEVIDRLGRLARSILRRLSPEELVAGRPEWRVVDAWPYGDTYAVDMLWRRLGIREVLQKVLRGRRFEFDVERALFALVANRICAPCSKLYCWEQWLRADVRLEGADGLALHHLYRAMDVLVEYIDDIERELFFRVSNLLNLDVELVFYDTTSLHFETDEEDDEPGAEEGPEALRKRGYSKNGRGDAPQVVIGMAVTRDGFPVRHWVFPGNTVDVTTVERVREELRGWKLSRCVFVGDAGMVSQDNLRMLARGGGRYIVSVPIRREKEVTSEVLGRAGRYKPVAENLRVKEVVIGDGERRRRYVVCHNPLEAERQKAHRDELLAHLDAELESLKHVDGEAHSAHVCRLRSSKRYGKYLRFSKGGRPAIDRARVREEERLDGKFVVHSNDDTLTPEDMALGYKQLMRAEQAWRTMKSGLSMRPVYHRAPHRIRAHIALNVLALLIERTAEHACGDTWRNIGDALRQVKLVELSGPDGAILQTTEPGEKASKVLKLLGIDNPPLVVSLG